jgi:hypothetical protein
LIPFPLPGNIFWNMELPAMNRAAQTATCFEIYVAAYFNSLTASLRSE